ncbi:MAG TPA: hypothetical protein VGI40_02505 [Pirellulaceae bacterium]|jgi:hypothetical protein
MKPFLLSCFTTAFLLAGLATAQDATGPQDEIQKLRGEAQRVEAEITRLAAHLQQLKEQLAKIEAQQRAANQVPTPVLRFPAGIERAMMGEAVPRRSQFPSRDEGIFDNKRGGPDRSEPQITPRK